jgi:hypothetical protein
MVVRRKVRQDWGGILINLFEKFDCAAFLRIATAVCMAIFLSGMPAVSAPLIEGGKKSTDGVQCPNPQTVIEKLGAGKEQIKRAVGRLDAEIWEVPGRHQASSKQVANLRQLQKDMKSANFDDTIFSAMAGTGKPGDSNAQDILEKFPRDMMKKVDAFLIGEAACQIMKEAELRGDVQRLTGSPDRLSKESVLSVRLGHLASPAELQDNEAQLASTIKNLKSDYPLARQWKAADHARIARLLKSQESKSEHWNPGFAVPTKNGDLGCASYITNGKVAKTLGEALMPSLDLNANGVVGELLIRGFQPRTVAEAIEEARKGGRVKHAMAFVLRPAVVGDSFGMTENGHIGFLDASAGEISHNKTAVGTRESADASEAFAPKKQPFVLVPPGWDKL